MISKKTRWNNDNNDNNNNNNNNNNKKSQKWIISQNAEIVKTFYTYDK
jgi:hypothetical protein